MNPLLNKMFAKRFGLPADADVENYKCDNNTSVTSCLCGNYNHVACILKGKGKGR